MKKVLASAFLLFLLSHSSFAQNRTQLRPRSLGVSFIMNDFTSAQRIRSSSFESVVGSDKWAKFREMSPGIAITYFKGLQKHIDFAGTIGGSFTDYPFPNRPAFGKDALLLEVDASVNFKMFPENYWVTPYLSLGVGASKYKSYYGAFIPAGAGIRVNLFDETSVFVQSQYRIPVHAENANYHFMYSIGVAGSLGRKR
jgi:OmpA-OmpF porin, OOP family